MSDFIPLSELEQTWPRTLDSVALIALGCAKNLVDAEQMLGILAEHGYQVIRDVADAEVVIVNTCSFLQSARDEAFAEIRAAARLKRYGRCQVLVVSGCLAQSCPELVLERCPEVDIVIGVSEFFRIAEFVAKARGFRPVVVSLPDLPYLEYLPRMLATPPWTAYQKIAEGCDCGCTFCSIPSIRGSFRSRPIEACVAEAERLAADGVRELVLIAEDLTHYGMDWSGRRQLGNLLRALGQVDGLDWIRLLYCYPTKVDEDLIAAMAEVDKVLPYLDIPLQHADDTILRAMRRGGRRDGYLRLIERLREAIDGICIRSTFIVGFPGEHRQEFAALESFVAEARLDRVGFFAYSPEPGTPAAELSGQVPRSVAEARIAKLAQRQAEVSLAANQAQVGRTLPVLIEQATPTGGVGRSSRDAPEIDGVVHVTGQVTPGSIVPVTMVSADVYDLTGQVAESP